MTLRHLVKTLLVTIISFACSFVLATAAEEDAAAMEEKMQAVDDAFQASGAEIGRAVGDLVAEQMDTSDDLIAEREAEFGRALGNLIRTFQLGGSYDHQANDALLKSEISWIEFAKDNNMLDEALKADIKSKQVLFASGAKKIQETGDLEVAMKYLTYSPCFRDLTVAEGYIREPGKISYVSPYQRVLTSGTLRDMHTITEEEIHELWTIPRIKAYGGILGVEFDISEWDEENRVITISVAPTS